MLNVKHILERSKDIPLKDAPFSKEIYYACLLRNIELDLLMTCEEALSFLSTPNGLPILTMPIDDMATGTDTKTNNMIAVWCFRITMLVVLLVASMTVWIAFKREEFPEFGLSAVCIIIPAMVMWNRMNLLKNDKAKAFGTLIGSLASLKGGKRGNNDDDEERPQQPYPNPYGYQPMPPPVYPNSQPDGSYYDPALGQWVNPNQTGSVRVPERD